MFILRALLNTGCSQLPVGALPMRLLWQLATLFTERHPSLRFQLFALSSDQILGRLNQNQFDVGIPILSVSTRRISRACRWVQHGCCTTGVTFAFQVPVKWEGAGEASARHVVERPAFSAITRSHVAQSRLESRPGLETDAVCRIWNTASVRAQSKHHPLPLDLLTETTSRDGQTPDLILQTCVARGCACQSARHSTARVREWRSCGRSRSRTTASIGRVHGFSLLAYGTPWARRTRDQSTGTAWQLR